MGIKMVLCSYCHGNNSLCNSYYHGYNHHHGNSYYCYMYVVIDYYPTHHRLHNKVITLVKKAAITHSSALYRKCLLNNKGRIQKLN